MSIKPELDAIANKIYEFNKLDWESKYYAKMIAIDVDAEKLIAVSDSLIEIDNLLDSICPDHKVLIRKVGIDPAVARVLKGY